MKYIFGPVPSRRLGQSLGIDTIPLKTCNWNCVYCQLGRTQPLVNQRREYYPSSEILIEVQEALKAHRPGEIDWVTFVGSGEPLLHDRMGYLIRQVKSMTDLPVAVITNGSLLYYLKYARNYPLLMQYYLPWMPVQQNYTAKSTVPTRNSPSIGWLTGWRLSVKVIAANFGLRSCWFEE